MLFRAMKTSLKAVMSVFSKCLRSSLSLITFFSCPLPCSLRWLPTFYSRLTYDEYLIILCNMRTTQRLMLPILLRWPMIADANVVDMAVEAEPSHQCPVTCCCHVTDGSGRGSLTKWRLAWKCRWSKGVPLNYSVWKKWHPLVFTDAYWMLMETEQWMWAHWGHEWGISAVVTVTVGHLYWCRCLWAWCAGSPPLLAKMHS